MRITSGCLKSAPTQSLLVTRAIAPFHLGREEATQLWVSNLENFQQTGDPPSENPQKYTHHFQTETQEALL